MYETVLKTLQDYRARFAELEKRYIENPIYIGWIGLSEKSTGIDFAHYAHACTGIYADIKMHIGVGETPYATFIIPKLLHRRIEEFDLRRQAADLTRIEEDLSEICDKLSPELAQLFRFPVYSSWKRKLFHLAWHFQNDNLLAPRFRLIRAIGRDPFKVDEQALQFHMKRSKDLFSGVTFSLLQKDIYVSSIAAIDFLIEMIEQSSKTDDKVGIVQIKDIYKDLLIASVSSELPTFKLLKLTSSFYSPPATKWAGIDIADSLFINLSRYNSDSEVAVIGGSQRAELSVLFKQAGMVLTRGSADHTFMFSKDGHHSEIPLFNSSSESGWIRFVLSTLRKHHPELFEVSWCSPPKEEFHHYGYLKLKIDLVKASILAIECSGLLGPEKKTTSIKPALPVRKRGPKPLAERDERSKLMSNLLENITAKKQKGVGPKGLLSEVKKDRSLGRVDNHASQSMVPAK